MLHRAALQVLRFPTPRTINNRRPGRGRGGAAARVRPVVDLLEARALLSADLLPGSVAGAAAEVAAAGGAFAAPQSGPVPTYPSGAMLVQLRPGVPAMPASWASRFAADGASVVPAGVANLYKVTAGRQDLSLLAVGLSADADVQYVEPERQIGLALSPNDPQYVNGTQWDMNGTWGVQAPGGWDVTTGSTFVTVADIDTGIDYNHPDLYNNVWLNQQEIPASRLKNLVDENGDGKITFADLNYTAPDGSHPNQGPGKVNDVNGDGRIDASDVLAPMTLDANGNDTGAGGWAFPGNTLDGDAAHPNDFVGWNFVTNTNDPFDDHGHGTHTAGTIAATGNDGVGITGVNWTAQVMGLKFIAANGQGSDDAAAAAIEYAVAHGARVSNNSWGGSDGTSSVLAGAVNDAANKGMIFVAAAGNSSGNNDTTPFYPADYTNPNVVAVAATDVNGALASFSNYGTSTVALAAPGVGVTSTLPNNSYAAWSGTSMAAPHVTGVMAAVIARHPTWTMGQVIGDVLNNTTADPALAGKVATGGIVSDDAALHGSYGPRVLTAAAGAGTTAQSLSVVRLTFSEPILVGSFTTAQAGLNGPSGPVAATAVAPVAGSGGLQFDVTFPAQTAAGTYTLTVGPNVTDAAGDAMDQNRNAVLGEATADQYTTTFAVAAPAAGTPVSLFSATSTPQFPVAYDPNTVELGVKFSSDVSGTVSAVKFYKGAGITGEHDVHLWTSTGTLLASGTYLASGTDSGWETVALSSPVGLTAGVTYVASYDSPPGGYAVTWYGLQSGADSGPLHVPASGSVYSYGPAGSFPGQGPLSSNYWVDVVFTPGPVSPPPPPPPADPSVYSFFSATSVPQQAATYDPNAVELGVKFSSDVPGTVSAVKIYMGAGVTGEHDVHLWTATGTLLASGTYNASGSDSGWQTVALSTPVGLSAGVTYVASYDSTGTGYAVTWGGLSSGVDSGPLHVPASGSVYSYGPAGSFPGQGPLSSNYWVDVVFKKS